MDCTYIPVVQNVSDTSTLVVDCTRSLSKLTKTPWAKKCLETLPSSLSLPMNDDSQFRWHNQVSLDRVNPHTHITTYRTQHIELNSSHHRDDVPFRLFPCWDTSTSTSTTVWSYSSFLGQCLRNGSLSFFFFFFFFLLLLLSQTTISHHHHQQEGGGWYYYDYELWWWWWSLSTMAYKRHETSRYG